MTFQVLILLLVSCLRWTQRIKGIPSSLSSCCPESGIEWKLLVVPLPPSAFFFFFLLLFKTKVCRTGTLVARFPSWRGVSAWAVCAVVSPRAFEGWRGRREVSPDMWVCASPEGGPGREEEEGGGYWRRRRWPGPGLSGKLLSCDGDDEVKWRIFRNTIPAPDIPEAAAAAASPLGTCPRPPGSPVAFQVRQTREEAAGRSQRAHAKQALPGLGIARDLLEPPPRSRREEKAAAAGGRGCGAT